MAITDEQFKKAIGEISDQYEAIKDIIHSNYDVNYSPDLLDQLAKFRDTACIAIRESHVQKNFDQN